MLKLFATRSVLTFFLIFAHGHQAFAGLSPFLILQECLCRNFPLKVRKAFTEKAVQEIRNRFPTQELLDEPLVLVSYASGHLRRESILLQKLAAYYPKIIFFIIDPIYHTAEGSESNPRSSLAILLRYVERKFAREDQEITVFPVGRVDNLLEFFEDGDDLRPHVIFDIDSDAFNDDSDLYRIFPSILRQNGVMLQLKHGFFDNPGAHAHTAGRVLTKGGDAEFMEGVRHPEATRVLSSGALTAVNPLQMNH